MFESWSCCLYATWCVPESYSLLQADLQHCLLPALMCDRHYIAFFFKIQVFTTSPSIIAWQKDALCQGEPRIPGKAR